MKRCAICESEFEPRRPMQKVCSPLCAMALTKKRQKELRLKESRAEKRKLNESNPSWLKAKIEHYVNSIARKIDYMQPCISCGNSGKPQAGHYWSVGAYPELRYNLHNIHRQDYYCNVHLSANIDGYREGLEKWYGKEYIEMVLSLPSRYKSMKCTVREYREILNKVKLILKELPEGKIYLPLERIAMREELNKKIGLY